MTRSQAYNASRRTGASNRMIHRMDLTVTIGRWAALLVVALVALLGPSHSPQTSPSTVMTLIGVIAALNVIPMVLLRLGAFGDLAALASLVLDSVFALALMVIGGPQLFCYCFINLYTSFS